MGFEQYTRTAKVAAVKTPRAAKVAKPPKAPRVVKDQATIMRLGQSNGFIVHLTVTATQRLGLRPGDRVVMAYNKRNGRFGFRQDENGDHVLQAHGANPKRVKWSVTAFLKDHDLVGSIEGAKIAAPLKTIEDDGTAWETF